MTSHLIDLTLLFAMVSEQVRAEIRKRYQFKQVMLDSLDKIFVPRLIFFASPNVYHVVQLYYAIHTQTESARKTNVLLSASNSEKALERCLKAIPSIVVVDKYLPPSGGYDFYFQLESELKEKTPPALLLLPPSDNAPIKRPRYGLIYLYRSAFNPMMVVQSVLTVLARHKPEHQAPTPAGASPTPHATLGV